MAAARPENMFAWRKHKGNPEPVSALQSQANTTMMS